MKYLKPTILSALILGLTACAVKTETHSSFIRVQEKPVSYLEEILPEPVGEIEIYNDQSEVIGEYIELGIVEIEEINTDNVEEAIMDLLKNEARELYANGVLLERKTRVLENGSEKTELRAVAIYALDKAVLTQVVASL